MFLLPFYSAFLFFPFIVTGDNSFFEMEAGSEPSIDVQITDSVIDGIVGVRNAKILEPNESKRKKNSHKDTKNILNYLIRTLSYVLTVLCGTK